MLITRDELQLIVDALPEKIDIDEVFDKIMLSAKIEKALKESEKGLGEDWDKFKANWLNGDLLA